MNFDSYKASNLQVSSPADNLDKFTILNDGANALAKENANFGKTLMAGATALIQQNENVKAIDANNYYNKLISDGMMKIQSKKEGEALNSVEDFKAMEQKAYAETKRKYGKYLYGRTGSIFEQARSRDANARRQQVEKYQMEQKEKYDDTTLTNSIKASYQDMGDNINDDAIIANNLAKVKDMIAGRYSSYGDERIMAEQVNWQNKMVKGLAKYAIDSNDYAAANRILNLYGDTLTPDERGPLAKAIGSQLKLDKQVNDFGALYGQFKGNLAGFMQAVDGMAVNFGGNTDRLVATAASMLGKNPKDSAGRTLGTLNTCAPFVREALRKAGMDVGKDGEDWVPTMLANAKTEGRAFTDRSQLRNGDIVFWETNNNWDDGSDHVGIYDASTNTVIQSGTSGIKRIGLNDYDLHSFAHPKGSEKAMTPSEKEKFRKDALAFYKAREAEENAITNEIIENGYNELGALIESGITDSTKLSAIVNKYSIGGDGQFNTKAYRKLSNLVKTLTKQNGAGSDKVPAGSKEALEDGLLDGTYASPQEMVEYAAQTGNGKLFVMAQKVADEFKNQKGAFAYDLTGVQSMVMDGYKGPDKAMRWKYIRRGTINFVNQYKAQHHGEEPTEKEVLEYAQNYMAKNIVVPNRFIGSAKFSISDLQSKNLVDDVIDMGNGQYRVTLPGKNNKVTMSASELKRLYDGEDVNTILSDYR